MTLRTQLVRLAQANPDLRPHLLPILASSTDMVSRLREVFADDDFLASASKVWFKVAKWGRDEVDATESEDKWGPSGHYTKDTGGFLQFSYPAIVDAKVDVTVTDLPYGSDENHVERVVLNLVGVSARASFQDDLDNDGELYVFLTDSVDPQGGSVSGLRWKVVRADVRNVDVQVRGDEARLIVSLMLAIDVDPRDAEVEWDGPDYGDFDRYASVKAQVLRLAAANATLRPHLLALVK